MNSGKLLDRIAVTFVESNGLALFDLHLDGGFAAEGPGHVVLQKLLVDRVLDHDTALSRGDIPFIGLHTISISNSRVGGNVDVVCEMAGSTSAGIINASENVESDRTRLVLHVSWVITDGALMSQAGIEGGCWVQVMLNGRSKDVHDNEKNVGDTVDVQMGNGAQSRGCPLVPTTLYDKI